MSTACQLLAAILIAPVAVAQGTKQPQPPKPGYRFEMKPGPLAPGPAVPVEKEAGDEVTIGPDGAIAARSRSGTFTFPLMNRMAPVSQVTYVVDGGRIRYQFRISNGAGARNAISSFAFEIEAAQDISASPPWSVLRVSRPAAESQIAFLRRVNDGDSTGLLRAGAGEAVVTLFSEGVPGLIFATFRPNPLEEATMKPEAAGFINSASPWVQQRLLELDTIDRRRVRKLVIGPTIGLAADSAAEIRTAITNASQLPECADLKDYMVAQELPSEVAGLRTWVQAAKKKAPRGLSVDFLDAMWWRLERLR